MFRSIHGSVCFYPSDAVSTERAIELAANYEGITFTRTSRPETSVIYTNEEVFKIGQAKVWGGGAKVWEGGAKVWEGGAMVWGGGTKVWGGGPKVWRGGAKV